MIHELFLFAQIIGACIALGTSAGIAFFRAAALRGRDPALIAHVASIVVLANGIFTATAAVIQPVTGYYLAQSAGWALTSGLVMWSLILCMFVGAFWLPVIWIQKKLYRLAVAEASDCTPLPHNYHSLYAIWFACRIPTFATVVAVVLLMITKPAF